MVNSFKLKGRMVEMGFNIGTLAEAVNISRQSLSSKINGSVDFSATEIYKVKAALNIDDNDVVPYFFANVVSISDT